MSFQSQTLPPSEVTEKKSLFPPTICIGQLLRLCGSSGFFLSSPVQVHARVHPQSVIFYLLSRILRILCGSYFSSEVPLDSQTPDRKSDHIRNLNVQYDLPSFLGQLHSSIRKYCCNRTDKSCCTLFIRTPSRRSSKA